MRVLVSGLVIFTFLRNCVDSDKGRVMGEYAVTIHPSADVHHTACLGDGSRIWAWSLLMEGVTLGKACVIGTCVEIGRRAILGDACRLQHGTALCDGAV